MGDVTQILSDIESGDQGAADRLLPLIYDELRRLAAAKMAGESPDHTLQPTALVHDAYVRLVDVEKAQRWDSRGHFFAAAAEAMRRSRLKCVWRKIVGTNDGDRQRNDCMYAEFVADVEFKQVLELDDALKRLEKENPRASEIVKLRFFAGLSVDDTAGLLGISPSTSRRTWIFARAWLRSEMEDNSSHRI